LKIATLNGFLDGVHLNFGSKPNNDPTDETAEMKTFYQAAGVVLISFFLFSCAGMQDQGTNTNRWGRPCPQWQSYANCAQNH